MTNMKKTINFDFFPVITSIMRNVSTFGFEMRTDNVQFVETLSLI
ncbi:hypothetical protein B4U80_01824 [Leptotrombidium deliense]|uniref:Uncharacterized protein n=1 Tax=Leptotrombidium deliense TaxID=299467 RepID=A0A443RWR7_9ACAR|nr:hypothetical protein B4U80_01824 [Leptotrombidium deliense]